MYNPTIDSEPAYQIGMSRLYSAKSSLKRHSSVLTLGYKLRQLNGVPTSKLLLIITQWIEECTGMLCQDKPLLSHLSDGLVLCKLIESIRPGLIKRINRVKSPFAWRENILFFLEACQSLGLRDSDLFTPEDLCEEHRRSTVQSKRISQETRLRRVCESLYLLGVVTAQLPDYTGPILLLHKENKHKAAEEFTSAQNLVSDISDSSFSVRKAKSVINLGSSSNSTYQQSIGEGFSCVNKPQSTSLFSECLNPVTVSVSTTAIDCASLPEEPSSPTDSIDFSPSVSEGSTVVYRDSHFSSSVASRRSLSDQFVSVSPTTHSQLSVADNEHFLNNPFSSDHLSNLPADPHIDYTGIISVTRSQDTLNLLYYPSEKDIPYHYSLTQKSVDNYYTNHTLDHSNLSEASTHAKLIPLTGVSQVNLPDHMTTMSSFRSSGSEPMDIPLSQPRNSIPHHCLDIGEADSPTSYQETRLADTSEYDVEVVLLAGEERLGLSLLENTNGILSVKAVGPGSASSRAGVEPNDELLSVDNTSLVNTPLNEALGILQEAMSASRLVLHVRRIADHIPRYKSHRPPDLLDMSRVISGALPHSLNATQVHLEPRETSELMDISIMDIMSSPDDPSSSTKRDDNIEDKESNSSHVTNDQATLPNVTKNTRPRSAPSKPQNVIIMAPEKSHTLPSKSSSGLRLTKDRQADREKSFQSNAQVLLKYAKSRHTVRTNGSIQRSSQSPVHTGKLSNINDGGHDQVTERSPSPEVQSRHSATSLVVADSTGSSTSTPLNLRHISMDETRIASVIEMDSIWRQVESEDDVCNLDVQTSATSINLSTDSRDANDQVLTLSEQVPDDVTLSEQVPDDVTYDLPNGPTVDLEPVDGFVAPPPLSTSISVDETRIASVIEMDSIWRQVENGDVVSNLDAQPSTSSVNLSISSRNDQVLTLSEVFNHHTQNILDGPTEDLEPLDAFTTSSPLATSSPLKATVPPTPPTPSQSTTAAFKSATAASHSRAEFATTVDTSRESESKEKSTFFSSEDIDSLLVTLKSLGTPNESADELEVLEQMLKSNTFKKAKKIHDLLHKLLSKDDIKPVYRRIVPSAQLLRQTLHNISEQEENVKKLRSLLRHPHIQALLFCHDKVSTYDLHVPDVYFHKAAQDPVDKILSESLYYFDTTLGSTDQSLPLSRDVPSGRKEGAVIVFVERTTKPLGITLYNQEDSMFIGKLISGGDAEASNVLREGDELLEVNGMPVWDKTIDHIITLMSPGQIEDRSILVLTIIPVHDDNIDMEYEIKYIRAHFNYNGRLDEEIPCKALGLAFQKGDILEISNQDDPDWWQARKVFDDGAESLPGLIPSRHLQQQREALVRSYPFTVSGSRLKKGGNSLFSKKKKKKVFYQNVSTSGSVGVGDEVPTYEEVLRLNPGENPNRPIILVGAPRVGKRALIQELVNSNPSVFSTVVSHTSRNPRANEVEGQDYFFVTKEEFESDMHRDRFLEYGEYKGAYYGTSFITIKRIMEASRVPVLDVHPQALKKLRYSGLQPYVIFVASPRLERLQFTRQTVSEKGRKSLSKSFRQSPTNQESMYTEFELKQMLEESLLIENQYGHYFDWIIVNDDFQVASDMLKEVVRRVEEEPQWIPALWKYDKY